MCVPNLVYFQRPLRLLQQATVVLLELKPDAVLQDYRPRGTEGAGGPRTAVGADTSISTTLGVSVVSASVPDSARVHTATREVYRAMEALACVDTSLVPDLAAMNSEVRALWCRREH